MTTSLVPPLCGAQLEDHLGHHTIFWPPTQREAPLRIDVADEGVPHHAFVIDDRAVAAGAHLELDRTAQPVAELVAVGERMPHPREVSVEIDLPSDLHRSASWVVQLLRLHL